MKTVFIFRLPNHDHSGNIIIRQQTFGALTSPSWSTRLFFFLAAENYPSAAFRSLFANRHSFQLCLMTHRSQALHLNHFEPPVTFNRSTISPLLPVGVEQIIWEQCREVERSELERPQIVCGTEDSAKAGGDIGARFSAYSFAAQQKSKAACGAATPRFGFENYGFNSTASDPRVAPTDSSACDFPTTPPAPPAPDANNRSPHRADAETDCSDSPAPV